MEQELDKRIEDKIEDILLGGIEVVGNGFVYSKALRELKEAIKQLINEAVTNEHKFIYKKLDEIRSNNSKFLKSDNCKELGFGRKSKAQLRIYSNGVHKVMEYLNK